MKGLLSKITAFALILMLSPLSSIPMAMAMGVEAGVDQTITLGDEVTVEAEADALDGATTDVMASINWGDGTVSYVTGLIGADHVSLDGAHTYTATGSYAVAIEATEYNSGGDISTVSDSLTVTVEAAAVCDYESDAYESNDSIETAYELYDGDAIEASLCMKAGEDYYDYYKVALAAGETLTATMEYTEVIHDPRVMLVDADGNYVEDATVVYSDTEGNTYESTMGYAFAHGSYEGVIVTIEYTSEAGGDYYVGFSDATFTLEDAGDADSDGYIDEDSSLLDGSYFCEVFTYSIDVSIAEPAMPDLVVTDIYLNSAETGFYATIENQGSVNIPDTTAGVLSFYIDGEDHYSYNWTTLSDKVFLEAGGSSTFGPFPFGDEETHTVGVYIDETDIVEESNEDNNFSEETFGDLSDLVVASIESPGDGNVSYTIENQGAGDVDAEATVYSSVTIVGPEGDSSAIVDLTDTPTVTSDLAFMSAGGSSTIEVATLAQAGIYEVTICVDSEASVLEENDDNNCTGPITVMYGVGSSGDDPVDATDPVDTTDTSSSSGGGGGGGGSSSSSSTDDTTTTDDTSATDDTTGGDVELASDEEVLADASDEELECSDLFEDTDGHWAEKAICLLAEAGTVNGRTETTFVPDDTVTRAELLKMILLNAGEEVLADETVEYTDVNADDWYYSYVTYGTSIGVVEGYDDGSFMPNEEVNRAEAVIMLMRMAAVIEYDADTAAFDDVDYESWYAFAVVAAVDLGIVEGYEEDNTFRPANSITRAEAATIVRRAWHVWYN